MLNFDSGHRENSDVSMRENPYTVAACIVTHNNSVSEVVQVSKSFMSSNFETHLTIVDNRSTNQILLQLDGKVPAQLIQSGTNKGFGSGHNIGKKNAPPCRYYLVLNPDVIIHEGTLEKLVQFMDEHPDVGLVAPKILNEDGSIQYLNKRLPTVVDMFLRRFVPNVFRNLNFVKRRMDYYVMKDAGYDKIIEVPYISGCFMLFRETMLDQVGDFDENFFMYLEDADMTVRIGKISKTCYYPFASVTHAWSRESYNRLKYMRIMIQSVYYYFDKWGWKWA